MAKRAKEADDETTPKAKRSRKRRGSPVAVKAKKSRARRAVRRNPAKNSSGGGWFPTMAWVDDIKSLGVGLGAYGTTRLAQRLATRLAVAKKPTWAKHVHALAGALVFGASLLAVRKVKQIAEHEGAIVIGTGLAAVQGVVTSYVPRFAWLMNDAGVALPASAAAASAPQATSGDYLEHELLQMEAAQDKPLAGQQVQKAVQSGMGLEESLVAELGDEDVSDMYGGVFANPTLFES